MKNLAHIISPTNHKFIYLNEFPEEGEGLPEDPKEVAIKILETIQQNHPEIKADYESIKESIRGLDLDSTPCVTSDSWIIFSFLFSAPFKLLSDRLEDAVKSHPINKNGSFANTFAVEIRSKHVSFNL